MWEHAMWTVTSHRRCVVPRGGTRTPRVATNRTSTIRTRRTYTALWLAVLLWWWHIAALDLTLAVTWVVWADSLLVVWASSFTVVFLASDEAVAEEEECRHEEQT